MRFFVKIIGNSFPSCLSVARGGEILCKTTIYKNQTVLELETCEKELTFILKSRSGCYAKYVLVGAEEIVLDFSEKRNKTYFFSLKDKTYGMPISGELFFEL